MIGTLWLLAQWTALAAVAVGVISHRWTGWAARPWWFAAGALASVTTTGHCLAADRVVWAAAYSVAALLAVVGMVLAVRRDRVDPPRHVERWDRL